MKFTGRIREPEKLTASFPALKLPLSGGYEEGYADGRTAGYTEGEQTATAKAEAHNAAILTDCNAVLPTKGAETADTLDQVPQRIGEIDAEGADAWRYVTTLNQTFQHIAFPDGYELTLNVPHLSNDRDIGNIIAGANGLRKLTLKCGQKDVVLRSYFAFANCSSIEEIDLSQFSNTEVVRVTKPNYAFYSSPYLKTIKGVLDLSQCSDFTAMFSGTARLENLKIAPDTAKVSISFASCAYLSAESIQSIIAGLADLTGATAQTITFHKDVGNKLTQAQKDTITEKNWTLVY